MFLTLKKRTIILFVCLIIFFTSVVSFAVIKTSIMPKPEYCIVIDAGHGGRDGGAVGTSTGITESELNLKYALQLQSLCEDFDIGVVMTRSSMNGLYDENASNKKKSEMEKRKKIINESNADLMISIHMNSFPLPSLQGAYVFYAKGSDKAFELAKSVQNALCLSFETARKSVSVGDYFVLNNSNIPAILIECGFLSNPQEEIKLQNNEYCKNFCYSVLAGIISYFKMK